MIQRLPFTTPSRRWGAGVIPLAVFLSALFGGAEVAAQGPGSMMPSYPFSNFRFNFINPGARASAMGQAFIALGDDATGSETNPAGLTALVKPQLFAEGRWIQNRFRTLARELSFPSYDRVKESNFSPTFLSVVYPLRQWAFGLYRQELANYSVSLKQKQVSLPDVYLVGVTRPFEVSPFTSNISLDTVNYGFSVARRWGERLNFGVSLRASRMAVHSLETVDPQYLSPELVVMNGDPAAVFHRLQGADWAFSFTAGVIVKPVDWLRVGAIYRSGSDHHLKIVFYENIAYRQTPDVPIAETIPDFKVRVPSRVGFGLAFVPSDRLTLTADLLHIRYGEMTAPFVDFIQFEFRDDYAFESGTSLRLGGEYTTFWGKTPISARVGFYTDPDNTLHFVGDLWGNDGLWVGSRFVPIGKLVHDFPLAQAALFPKVGTDFHLTVGMGVTVKNHLQLEWAADLAGERNNVVVSVLYNF